MNSKLWGLVDSAGVWLAKSYGFPAMTGRVLGWLLVCDPPEQTAADLAEALGASAGAISGATNTLVRYGLAERLRVRGERMDRFRLRPEAWDAQLRDQSEAATARGLIAQGLDVLADEPPERRRRLEELDAFYAFWAERIPQLWPEWDAYRRRHLAQLRKADKPHEKHPKRTGAPRERTD